MTGTVTQKTNNRKRLNRLKKNRNRGVSHWQSEYSDILPKPNMYTRFMRQVKRPFRLLQSDRKLKEALQAENNMLKSFEAQQNLERRIQLRKPLVRMRTQNVDSKKKNRPLHVSTDLELIKLQEKLYQDLERNTKALDELSNQIQYKKAQLKNLGNYTKLKLKLNQDLKRNTAKSLKDRALVLANPVLSKW
jgi:hypothetical protein